MKTPTSQPDDRNTIYAFFAGLAFAAAAIGTLVAVIGAVLLLTNDPYAERLLASGGGVGIIGATLFAFVSMMGRKSAD